MNLKKFKGQILSELPNCNEAEIRELIPNLLSKIEEIHEVKIKLTEENNELKEQNASLEAQLNNPDFIEEATIKERDDLLEHARQKHDALIHDADLKSEKIIQDAKDESEHIIAKTIVKIQNAVAEIECIDQQQKVFRSHILSLFKHNIFKFSDSEYYFIKSVDKDLQELLAFFEKDERIKRIFEKNMKKLKRITKSMENFDPTCNNVINDDVIDDEENHNNLTSMDSQTTNTKQYDFSDHEDGNQETEDLNRTQDSNSEDTAKTVGDAIREQITQEMGKEKKKVNKKSPSFLDLINSINDREE